MSKRSELEEFILKEFFEGKSVEKLISDYMLIYEGNKSDATKAIYKVLYEYANSY